MKHIILITGASSPDHPLADFARQPQRKRRRGRDQGDADTSVRAARCEQLRDLAAHQQVSTINPSAKEPSAVQ